MADTFKVNNIAYNWSMVQLISTELGEDGTTQVLQGVSGIKWNKRRDVKPNYGRHGKQVSRGLGNEVCTASITMDYATQVLLRAGLNSLKELGSFDCQDASSCRIGTSHCRSTTASSPSGLIMKSGSTTTLLTERETTWNALS